MNRRDTVLALLALGAAPLAVRAQPAARPARIAYLGFGSPEANGYLVEAFKQEMRNLGHIEGNNAVFEVRWALLRVERLPVLAKELVALDPDVIIAMNARVALVLKQTTTSIPIVIGSVSDPVGMGLVQSLAHPGGNISGTSTLIGDFSPKLLEFLLTAVPRLPRAAILYGPDTGDAQKKNIQAAAQALGVSLVMMEVRTLTDIESAFARMIHENIRAFIGLASGMVLNHGRQIAELAIRNRMPSVFTARENSEAGGLISYGPSLVLAARDAARYADKIIKGAKPANLPVEQARTIELTLNLKTAREIGLIFPQSLLILADRVIE